MKKTKIICTMGPNTNDRDLLKQLIENGMDVARFNFSHGDYEERRGRIELLKSIREELRIPVAMLLDTKGPEIRTGLLKDGKKVELKAASVSHKGCGNKIKALLDAEKNILFIFFCDIRKVYAYIRHIDAA